MIPLFLSIGCRRTCPYCYVPKSNYPYGIATWNQIKTLLDYAIDKGYNVHFLDENFFKHPLLKEILAYLHNKNLKWVALADSISFSNILRTYSEDYLLSCGYGVAEIGLETIDSTVLNKVQELDFLLNTSLPIIWLLVTFLPNDTIRAHNLLGAFLRQYGIDPKKMLPRIRTNSTEGGLGQFFQPYPGTDGWIESHNNSGILFNHVSVRLKPTFISDSFLDSKYMWTREINNEDKYWFSLYMAESEALAIAASIGRQDTIRPLIPIYGTKAAIVAAQLARLNIITARE
jgi:hypothetical protein